MSNCMAFVYLKRLKNMYICTSENYYYGISNSNIGSTSLLVTNLALHVIVLLLHMFYFIPAIILLTQKLVMMIRRSDNKKEKMTNN